MGRLGRVERAESQTVLPLRWLVLGRKKEKEGEGEKRRRERKKEERKRRGGRDAGRRCTMQGGRWAGDQAEFS